ncbi:hypothetical protein C7974DRAFT_384783 [Boeremia exigua]|uniref:uncharacterized protein n=1 Tax=Boeremia exigua TaxID=749465 RepID=UPI001E8E2AC5|nr:uncharacterized protein C7974DRAFT_384783 [Boeremia exigua]KAH6642067.1 hypothetical protein C7974DRAFT_384783 [Boeremia exigua]
MVHDSRVHRKATRCNDEGYATESASSDSSHRPEYECLMCDRLFTTYGGMILHLESGCCSDIDCADLDRLAANCSRWREFVDINHRDAMLRSDDISAYLELYFCPCCEMPMTELSGLFQHVESGACEQTLDVGAVGQLRRYLAVYVHV